MNGLFVNPFRRLSATHAQPIGILLEYPSVLAVLFLLEVAKLTDGPRRALSIVLLAVAAGVLASAPHNDISNIIGLASVLGSIPVLVIAALVVLLPLRVVAGGNVRDEQLLALLLIMTALLSLIQFPYASPGYFCYVAPLAVLLAAILISRLPRPPRAVLCAGVAFYTLFGVFIFRPHFLGSHYRPEADDSPLNMPRTGGLLVTAKSAAEYNELIAFVKEKSSAGPIFAGPDCPEIYFLSGIKNQTPVLFDSLVDPIEYEQIINGLFNRPNFLKVAILKDSTGSAESQLRLLQTLVAARFSNSRKIGRFTVYWRP